MLVLAGLGQHAEALRVFEDVRTRLRDDLGVDPDPVLRDAQARVLAQETPAGHRQRHPPIPPQRGPLVEPGPDSLVPRQLPPRPAAFTGRSAELAEIARSLDPSRCGPPAVVMVDGMPGVGKSALAILAAYQASAAFPDGVLYADLSTTTPGARPVPALEVLHAFLSALDPGGALDPGRGWTSAGERESVGRYRSLMASRRILIVLDGAASAAQVRPLLPTGEGSAALVTSRETLPSLDASATVTVHPLSHDDSLGVLIGMIPGARLHREPAAAAILGHACEGLPLALRIVAAQSQSRPLWPVTRMASRLGDRSTRLAALRHGDLSVAASFRSSVDCLRLGDPLAGMDAAHAFVQLGVLTISDISLGAAQVLLDIPGWRVEHAMERLADAHLLDSPSPGWYRMHGLLRLFSADLARTELAAPDLLALRSRARRLPPVMPERFFPVEDQRQGP